MKASIRSAIVFLTLSSPLLGASLNIYNDSPYLLYAEILTANGKSKGTFTLTPLNLTMWQGDLGNSTWAQTPFTVIFTCKNGTEYGVQTNVQVGATISALASDGKRFCQKPKKEDQNGIKKAPSNPGSNLQPDPIWGPP